MVIRTLCLLLLVLSSCAPPPQSDNEPPRETSTSTDDQDVVRDTSVIDTSPMQPPETLPVDAWLGETFVFLPKNRMFEKFGYEIHTTPEPSAAKSPADAAVALKNYRLRADIMKGRSLVVDSIVKRPDGEYFLRFRIADLEAFGTTKKGTLEGIAHSEDLEKARHRWNGSSVYSARRLIDTFDTTTARFGSIKVSITEPLKVVDVRWGRTPLPPKPLWVVVQRKDGTQGFIPVHYSWTNVLPGRQISRVPWESDLLEYNPRSRYSWDEVVWETIDNHNIFTGMNPEQVRLSWGLPIKETMEQTENGASIRRWVFETGEAVFVNDSLTGQ